VVLGDVLEDVERHDEARRTRTHRQVAGVRTNRVQAPVPRHPGAVRVVLQGQRPPAVRAQHPRVTARGRPDVQGTSGRDARLGQPAQFPRQQRSALAIPPVAVLQRGELADLQNIHGVFLPLGSAFDYAKRSAGGYPAERHDVTD
jgi:hypothetical protein